MTPTLNRRSVKKFMDYMKMVIETDDFRSLKITEAKDCRVPTKGKEKIPKASTY